MRWAPDVYGEGDGNNSDLEEEEGNHQEEQEAVGGGPVDVIGERLQSGKKLVKQMTKDLEVYKFYKMNVHSLLYIDLQIFFNLDVDSFTFVYMHF